jgi:ABC-type branched-subunit amino acid transport system ATPase component
MSDSAGLFLSSLRVEGVRAIRFLEIESLGRVNLFVGPNNAGKSSLLEALRLYAARGIPQAFRDILQVRGNLLSQTPSASLEEWGILMEAVAALFNGGLASTDNLRARVGPVSGNQPELVVALEWRTPNNDGRFALPTAGFPVLAIQYAGEPIDIRVEQLSVPPRPYIENQVPFAVFVPPSGIGESRLGALWDRITLTEAESLILDTLRIIVPELQGLSFVIEAGHRRAPVAKLADQPRPIPLRNMGDGVNRVLSIALAMVNARGGFLLIDEFENGLYHGVQAQVWKAIFELAERLDIQVFATTHSWDCIVAFQGAANRSPAAGMLFRLEKEPDGSIYVESYTEQDIAVAAEHQVEVR